MSNFNKSATQDSVTFVGGGAFYVADVDELGNVTGAWEFLGIVTSGTVSIEVTETEAQDPTSGINELFSKLVTARNASLSLTLSDFDYKKIAQHLFGTYSELVSEAVVDEEHTVNGLDTWILLDKQVDQSTIVVKDQSDQAYVEDVDYETEPLGIKVLSTGSITDAEVLKISYTTLAEEMVEAFTKDSNKKAIKFQGLSRQDGKTFALHGYKVSFTPMSAMALIAPEEAAQYELTGSFEKVSGKTDSPFYDIKKLK